ncbi:Transcription factor, MADS-box [Corchorus capsularis]|uniref:Transcription factor, MADS-box n=1 Tax=Corchorus capsularis TaxID=210143 RepID=A0A1R3IS35_COCAP|nr:Transcription factor, MADS-box [Corchorus capsularis]
MGRGKVELKRIEDKSSRQVTFSKRKNGLIKKARELAVLCDVELALVIFSPRGKLYQFSSGESLRKILERYQIHVDEEAAIYNSVHEAAKSRDEHSDLWRATSLQEMVERHIEGQDIQQLNMTQLINLEKQLDSILRQTRNRKTQLMMDTVDALHEKENQLKQEKNVMENKIAAEMQVEDGEKDDELNQEDPHSDSNQTPLGKGLLQFL